MSEDIRDLENILRRMTITLGNPALQYVLASEGNTSVKTDDSKRMVIKAGGTTFLNPDFVVVEVEKALQLLSHEYTTAEVSDRMRGMVIDYRGQKPSKEVTFHAALKGYKWIVHTHAREIEGFVCSKAADDARRRSQYIKKLRLGTATPTRSLKKWKRVRFGWKYNSRANIVFRSQACVG